MEEESMTSEQMLAVHELETQLQEELDEAKREMERLEAERQAMLDNIAMLITKKYRDRSARRGVKEAEWIKAQQLYSGSLAVGNPFSSNPDQPFAGSKTNKRPDRNIVYAKCEIAKAQLISMQFAGDENNWELLPPSMPSPDVPDMSERVNRMEATISDQLEHCSYKSEACMALHDYVVLGTGVLKGPINSGKTYKRYVAEQGFDGSVVWRPEITAAPVPEIRRVNVWYFYPDDTVTSLKDIEDSIEVHPMSHMELAKLRKNPGFISEVIDEVLQLGPNEYASDSYADFTDTSDTNPNVFRNKYTVLEYHGPITRSQLEKLEIDPAYDVPGDSYFGEVWVCNGKVVRIELENIEGCGKPPYSGDVWQQDPASPFGHGVAIKLADAQRVVTQAWHMILDNASASSAPQIVINEEMIDPQDGAYEIDPGKIWNFKDISGDVSKAFQFFITPNVTAQLFPVLEAARASSEEDVGIALMSASLQSPQVGSDTATGQAIEHRAATVLLDQKSDSWDTCATEPRIRAMYDWNMQYNPDPSIKANMELRIRSSTEYRNKQMFIRDMEKLSVETANNPETAKHVDMGALTRARLSMMNIPSGDIVKTMEQVSQEEAERQANQQPDPEMIKAQAEMKRLELEERRLANEEAKLRFEMNQNQQREAWEREERMVASYARLAEIEGQVVKSQNEKEIALLQIAAKAESEAERNRLTALVQVKNDDTKRYLGGMQAQIKARDQLLYEREMDLKRDKGEGI